MYTDQNILEVLEKYKKHAEAQDITVYAVALKGSQNYNLADENKVKL